MTKEKRVLLAGFRAFEVRALLATGLDIRVSVEVRGARDGAPDPRIETHSHFEAVRCEIDPPAALDMDPELRRELYDRAFPMFRRHYSRMTLLTNMELRSWTNLDNMFALAAGFYFDLLRRQEIETVIFANFPHEGSYIILYHLARLMKVETIIATQSNFPGLMWLVREIEDFGPFQTISGGGIALPLPAKPEMPFYMKRTGRVRRVLETSGRVAGESLKMAAKVVTLKFAFDRMAVLRNRNRLAQAMDRLRLGDPSPRDVAKVDLDRPFVYFPLHLQPEMTTDTWGAGYGDQLLAIEELAAALPEGMLIYAKENPVQTRFMREESFFRRMRLIPNLRYVSSEVPTFELIAKSRCVATISGTAGWEAALMGKGAIYFGLAWYSSLPGVFHWEGPETLRRALEHRHARSAFEHAFEALSRKLYPGVVDPAYAEIVPDFDKEGEARKAAASIASAVRAGAPD